MFELYCGPYQRKSSFPFSDLHKDIMPGLKYLRGLGDSSVADLSDCSGVRVGDKHVSAQTEAESGGGSAALADLWEWTVGGVNSPAV